MRAAVVPKIGGKWEVREVPTPEPSTNQVLCLRGNPTFCAQQIGTSIGIQGSHAEFMVAFADASILLPDGLAMNKLLRYFAQDTLFGAV